MGVVNGTAGAATGYALCSATFNPGGQVFGTTNDPVRQPLLAHLNWAGITASGNISFSTGFIPSNRRVKAGDVFACEQTLGGTAAASLIQRWLFFVEEAS
jgi:hypothetical protein